MFNAPDVGAPLAGALVEIANKFCYYEQKAGTRKGMPLQKKRK